MCELIVVRAGEPFALGEAWELAARMERFGLAGYGWGAAWLTAAGEIAIHRDDRAFRDDPAREDLAATETASLLVHLRRPSKLSNRSLSDTQPFLDPAGRFALGHNGDFRDFRALRERYRAAGRIHGRADSEVGARWLEDHWTDGPPGRELAALHRTLGGQANLGLLGRDGTAALYAGNTENPAFSFRLGRLGVLATGLYSIDRSLFRLAAPGATARRVLRLGMTATITPYGAAAAA
ncbi:MAG: class II glutamine amidotransferase [Candidatus Limnocylindrales bacterium]